jgi:hypothetical protein
VPMKLDLLLLLLPSCQVPPQKTQKLYPLLSFSLVKEVYRHSSEQLSFSPVGPSLYMLLTFTFWWCKCKVKEHWVSVVVLMQHFSTNDGFQTREKMSFGVVFIVSWRSFSPFYPRHM